jgi:hypothetical protein
LEELKKTVGCPAPEEQAEMPEGEDHLQKVLKSHEVHRHQVLGSHNEMKAEMKKLLEEATKEHQKQMKAEMEIHRKEFNEMAEQSFRKETPPPTAAEEGGAAENGSIPATPTTRGRAKTTNQPPLNSPVLPFEKHEGAEEKDEPLHGEALVVRPMPYALCPMPYVLVMS